MEITSEDRRSGRFGRARRAVAVVTAAVLAFAGLMAAAPASAADPWIAQQEGGYLRIAVPNAAVEAAVGPVSQVVVEGNFGPSHNWAQIGLQRSGANWTATYGPFEPGLYYYQVTGDDSKVLKDTSNPTSVASEPEWSTFFIPGESAALLADAPEQAGVIQTLIVRELRRRRAARGARLGSADLHGRRARSSPVLYLQHGGGQSYRDWVEVGRAEQILDNLWLRGQLEDMLVVMGNGNVDDFSAELLENIVPAVERTYNVSPSKNHRALAGLSMGGGQAFEVFSEHPGEFDAIGTFGAGRFGDLDAIPVDRMNDRTELFRVYVGNKTDIAYNDVYDSFQKFDALGLEYQFDGVNPDAGHNWNAWQENLIDFAPRLFTGAASDPAMSEGHTALTERFEPPAAGHDAHAVAHRGRLRDVRDDHRLRRRRVRLGVGELGARRQLAARGDEQGRRSLEGDRRPARGEVLPLPAHRRSPVRQGHVQPDEGDIGAGVEHLPRPGRRLAPARRRRPRARAGTWRS